MATDMADTLARSMSLSRRYLSLPQELAGTSLPPKVSGKRRGVVTLCVAHILPSAVSSAPLPRESLVRVRWWGEETPRSLFRPSLLSGDVGAESGEAPHSPQRAIAMKYPVSVLPEQLLEYFQDMGHLTLDVIDRQSRRKFGQCWLPLDVHKDNQVMTAEEKLVALSRDDVLCEIKPSGGDDGDVAGYLAVTFGVKWTESPVEMEDGVAVESVEKEESLVAASNDSDETRGKLETERTDDALLKRRRRKLSVENRGTSEDFQRIQKLLAKGKALQKSMERAVTEVKGGHGEESDVGLGGEEHGPANVAVDDSMQQMREALLLNFDAEPASQWDKVSAGDGRLPNLSKSKLAAFSFELDNDVAAQQDPTTSSTLLKGLNALKISFESLELDRDFVDNQLRQLRDSSNVSSRFSPIQVRVSHDDISSLMYPDLAGANVPEVPAFAVTTSLRTHQWQLECSSTMSLTPPASLIGNTSTEGSSTKWRDSDRRLRFFVRCENRSDVRRNQRRHGQNLFPRASKRVLLEGAVDASVLFAVAEQTDKTWATTVQINLASDFAESNISTSAKRRVGKIKASRNKKLRPVGYLKLNFEFFNVNPDYQSSASEGRSAGNEAESELLLSSISASSSEADPKRQVSAARHDLLLSDYPVPQRSQHEVQQRVPHEAVLSNIISSYKSFQFAVMLEDVSNVVLPALADKRVQSTSARSGSSPIVKNNGGSGGDANLLDEPSISLHYTVPSLFTRDSPLLNKFERTVTRKLRTSRWLDSTSSLWADFSGNIHVFQPGFADDSSEYFSSGFLIIEAWLNTTKNAERRLLGLSKVPLRQLAALFSHDKTELLSFSEKSVPFVDVDDGHPIENPFTGHLTGFLRARVCLGTADQLLTWAKTIRAVVKLQAIIRGVFSRKHFRRSRFANRRAVSKPGTPGIHAPSITLSHEESRSDSRSTVPLLSTGIGGYGVAGLDDSYARGDTSENLLEYPSDDDWEVYDSAPGNYDSRPALHKIRFDIRESWRSAMPCKPGDQHQQRNWSAAPLLGCELQGQLVLTSSSKPPGKVKGMPFSLWWDAADRNLNSSFSHTFGSRKDLMGERAELALVGPQSQVLFALHVENGFIGTQSQETLMGEARLNLNETWGKRVLKRQRIGGATQNVGVEDSCIDVDIPIGWEGGESDRRTLPSAIPLKISFHISQPAMPKEQIIMEAASLGGGRSYNRSVGIGASDAPEKRLKPACIALSFHLLSMVDFEYLLNEKSRQLFAETSAGMNQSSVHLRDILNRGRDTQFALFDVTICLGGELDERENVFRQEERLIRDTTARVFVGNGKWYKRWRSPEVTIRVNGGSRIERFDTISPQLAMQAHMLLNPDTVATLQEACAEVAVLLSCSTCGEPHELGCVDVPLAAVLFRPQGVRGMFPIRMGEESSGGRVGVHCFVNHAPPRAETDVFQGACNDNVSRFTDIQLKPASTTPPLMSPTSPDEIVRAEGELLISRSMKSCEVCVEEGRNLIVNDDGATPRLYAAFRIAKERGNQALQEPFVTPEKRTGVRAGMCPQWNYRDTLDVDKADWQSVSLELSVWQNNRMHSTGFHPVKRSQSCQLENDVYVGMARVDLSLFNCGWSDVDGWYHIQDAQHQTRGQVKIHVRNLRMENTLNPTKVVSSWGPHQTEPAGDFDQQYSGSITDDKAATLQFSLGKGVQAVHQASAEIEERLAIFQMPETDSQVNTSPCTNLVFDLNKATGNEGDTLKPSKTTPCADLQELVSDAQDAEAEVDGPDEPYRAGDIDDSISDPNDDSSASNDDDSDCKSLELNADYFKPVTLAFFGIEEMEFSPLAEDEAPADENEQDTIAESAEEDTVVHDQFGKLKCGEEEKKLRGTARSSGSGVGNEESHDIDGLWREAPGEQRTVPEQTKIDTSVKDVASVGFELEELDSDIDGEDTFSTRLADSTTTSEEEVIEARNRGSSRNDGAFSTNSASLSDRESSVSSGGAASDQDSDVFDDDKDANVQADHSHVAHKPPPTSTVTMNMNVEKANALDTVVAGTAADTVPSCNMDLADQSCGDDAAPSDTVMDFDTGKEVQLEPDASSAGPISASEVQYADKATQVGPFELGLQVEMVACSVQTAPSMDPKQECDEVVSEDVDDDANLSDPAEDAKQSVDVGCDAMDIPIEKHRQPVNVETRIPRPQGVVELVSDPSVSSVEQPSSSNQSRSCLEEETHRRVGSLNNPEAHTTLQNEKIELVYEMLREMRDSYLAKPVAKSASGDANDGEYSEKEPKLVTVPSHPLVCVSKETSGSRFSCPGSPIFSAPILHRVARKLSLDGSFASASGLTTSNIMVNDKKEVSDKRCSCPSSPLARDPSSLQSRGVSLHENVASMTMGKPACVFERSPKKTSFQVQSIGRRAESKSPDFDYHSPASGRMLPTSLRDTEERRRPRDNIGSISRLSSSDVRAFQRRSSFHNSQVEEKDQHSSVHSLFTHDSETERIARIMQGSMNYWMKEDSSSSCDDEVDDEEDTDDNCYF